MTSTFSSPPISGTVTSITDSPTGAAATGSATTGAGAASATGAGAGSAAGTAGAAGAAADAALIFANNVPSEILSPTATQISAIDPANGAGISIEALSLSTVIIESSASTLSPTATQISITSTASSPKSGTNTSLISDITLFLMRKVG